ncbi:MAG: hypothetical protein ABIN58_12655 [candidate division WOR-3 bacterium]
MAAIAQRFNLDFDDAYQYVVAEKYGLVVTGGTDYHGMEKNGLDIGIGKGEMRLPYSIVENLKKARDRSFLGR